MSDRITMSSTQVITSAVDLAGPAALLEKPAIAPLRESPVVPRVDHWQRDPQTRHERTLRIFLAIWFVTGIAQSIFTNLNSEESYYAEFARHLAWGYFDHPPALAMFIRLGMMLFPGYLGARFMIVALSTATLWIGSRLIEPRHYPFYIVVACGLGLVEVGAFVIKTDVPLIFFVTVFFYFFRNYLRGKRAASVVPLSIAVAGMILSKYHGILIVFLTLLSTPSLLKRPSFWMIVALSLCLTLPHAMWLYSHDFITLRFHLGGRNDERFEWIHVLDYVLMQPLVLGPAIGFLLLPAALLARPHNSFERVLKFDMIGILLFFLVASFTVRVHMHWTSVALPPTIALAIPYLYERAALRNLTAWLAVATALAIIPVRLYLAWDFLPRFIDQKLEVTHDWRLWAQDIHRVAAGRNIVFLNDFGSAAKYEYYTGEPADSYNTLGYRFSQQNLWPFEDDFRGKPAMLVTTQPIWNVVHARNGATFSYRFVNDLELFSQVDIRPVNPQPVSCGAGQPFALPIHLENRSGRTVVFKKDVELSPTIAYTLFQGGGVVASGTCDTIGGLTLENQLLTTLTIDAPNTAGNYTLWLSIKPGWMAPSINGTTVAMHVTEAPTPTALNLPH